MRINKENVMKPLNPAEHPQKPKLIEQIFPKSLDNTEIKDKLNEFKKLMQEIDRDNLKYETNKYIYDFEKFQTIRSFGDSIFMIKLQYVELIKTKQFIKKYFKI